MIEPYSKEIEAQMQELYSRLPEKSRRLYAGVEALTHLRDFYLPKLLILRPGLFYSQKFPLRSMVFFLSLL
jgi:hypothetical protein